MLKYLIKRLSEIFFFKKKVPHMLAPRRRCLDYSKVDFDVTEKGLLACHQSKQITYYIYIYIYIYYMVIPNSV